MRAIALRRGVGLQGRAVARTKVKVAERATNDGSAVAWEEDFWLCTFTARDTYVRRKRSMARPPPWATKKLAPTMPPEAAAGVYPHATTFAYYSTSMCMRCEIWMVGAGAKKAQSRGAIVIAMLLPRRMQMRWLWINTRSTQKVDCRSL